MSDHPVRLDVTDDLARSRLTVFFRLLLALPHFLWLGLWGVLAFLLAFVNWWATLFRGESPRGLHDFLAGYVRYAAHVEAYIALAANPYPGFFMGTAPGPYPVDVEIDPPARQNRWTTGFRLLLAVPAALLTSAFAGSAAGGRSTSHGPSFGLVGTAAFLTWFAALARGRAPRGLRDLSAWGVGYSAQAWAYLFLLTARYPTSAPTAHLHSLEPAPEEEGRARLVVSDDLRRSRLTVFFRFLLALPHFVWLALWVALAVLAAVANWVAALATGRPPQTLARFLAAFVRYSTHVNAFLYLVGNPFPGFVGKPGSYPIDVELDPPDRQSRWVTLFRLPLAVPAALVASALSGVFFVAAFLAWFASLARGRMPEGLRDAGAHALRYGAQLAAYLLILTDRYPYSGPPLRPVEPPSPAEAPAAA